MMSRNRFLAAIDRTGGIRTVAYGTGTSIACRELMERTGAWFPEAHLDAQKMASLAMAGHTVLGLDVVMPLFSVCHEAAAMGCRVQWGGPETMPECGRPIFKDEDDIRIPADLLRRPGCKVFGSWTQGYHYFGVENFLIGTLDDPDKTRRILDRLLPVTFAFAQAQIDAGADCILLADHATRDLCSPLAYREFLLPLHRRLAAEIKAPVILHICGNTSDRVGMVAQTGLDCFHWDTKSGRPEQVRAWAGPRLALMGGISNLTLFGGTPDEVIAQRRAAIAGDIDVIGPECAIPLTTPLVNLRAVACG